MRYSIPVATPPNLPDGGIAGVQACCGARELFGDINSPTRPCEVISTSDPSTCTDRGGVVIGESCADLQFRGIVDEEGYCKITICCPECTQIRRWDGHDKPSLLCQRVDVGICGGERIFATEKCFDELGACCQFHIGGTCFQGGETECEEAFGIFQGVGTNCDEIECPVDPPDRGCRLYEPPIVPEGLTQWSHDMCHGIVFEAVIGDDTSGDSFIGGGPARLFDPDRDQTQDPCSYCRSHVCLNDDYNAIGVYTGRNVEGNDLYRYTGFAEFVIDPSGQHGGMKGDAVMIGGYATPLWYEFMFLSHTVWCKGPFE